MEFETEEQQVEALKKWWKENGKQIIFGTVIGFGLIIGWRYYLDYSVKQTSEASALFEQMLSKNSESSPAANKQAVFEKIKKDYDGTPYSSSAGLVLAKSYYDAGNKDKALETLDYVITNTKDKIISQVAQQRKARILIDLGKAEQALLVLSTDVDKSFIAIFEELKGDAFILTGDIENAKKAYDKALLNSTADKTLLQMKRDDLGETTAGSAA
ncbi:MAG: tetratricopeptide repeat protein [Gammaproteobacteria bacterium]|nr:tetratricopeptide repeat protein [Gammaproteobacteria bacterium]